MSRAKAEYMCLNGTPLGSVKMQSAQLSQVTEFKFMSSTLQSDGGIMNTEVNKRTQCGCNNLMKISDVLCNKIISPWKDPQDDRPAIYAVRDVDNANE